MKNLARLILCACLFQGAASRAADTNVAEFAGRGVSVHDPSTIVKCKNEYWVFATGRGIVSRHSKDLIFWHPGPSVFSNAPSWTTNTITANHGHFWAPDVFFMTNRYLLYYAISSWGKRDSAIGLATNATLDPSDPSYHWIDCGMVFRTYETNDYNAIDPAIIQSPDGRLWMVFGSYWSGIKLTELDPQTGLRINPNSPVFSLAYHDSIEASYLYRHDDYYYLFLDWGQCCRGVRSTYNIRVGRSKEIVGPYLDKDGKDMLHDGGTAFLQTSGTFIGPGHAGIISADGKDWLSCHFYDGSSGGRPTLGLFPLRWDNDGWPVAEMPAAK
jgi:arabinan endo-1,5-alpha-L-arabinosidase